MHHLQQFCLAVLVRAAGGAEVVAGVPFTPEIFYPQDSTYYKICGHYFWDDDQGASAACLELGFVGGGEVVETRSVYATDAMPVGRCIVGERLDRLVLHVHAHMYHPPNIHFMTCRN